jgi:YidC/Oxa1 family membrane protein insertase
MIDFLVGVGSAIMTPLYYVTSAILVAWHWLFTQLGMNTDSGYTWVLSIVGLTITIRALLIPLFVRQIKSSRNMQLLQPRVKELQKKYGHDRERLGQETMKLYKESGTNPFASCLPLILQAPIFLALFRLLDNAAHGKPKGILTQDHADSLRDAEFLGAQIADTFTGWLPDYRAGEAPINVGVLTVFLVLSMVATTFITQRQLMRKNMPAAALTGQYAQQQKLLLYVLPVVFAVGGIAFPIGVILYWTTSNLWTMGQQFYVIRNNPAPGTPAFAAKQERDRKHGKTVAVDPTTDTGDQGSTIVQPRQQPKRQPRSQRRPAPPASGASTRKVVNGEAVSPNGSAESAPPTPPKPIDKPGANKAGANKSAAGKPGGSKPNPNRSKKKRRK